MKLRSQHMRMIAVALLASLAIGTLAPAAWAGRGRGSWNKHRRGPVVRRVVEVHRSDSFVPAFAGFIGGLALGAAISNAHAYDGPRVQAHAAYYYWDPYCRVRYASLDAYGYHLRRGCDHPHRVRVISVSSGECVRWMGYHRGDWRECDPDWDRSRWDDDRGDYYEDDRGWDR